MDRKALIAMSGGVDSSVTAYLMKKEGYSCTGITMKLFSNEDANVADERTCCSLKDSADAASVAAGLGIPYYVLDFTEEFNEKIIHKFIECYETGRTPNPCIDCNRYMKFGRLFAKARELGADHVATGHYARIERDETSGRWLLKKSADKLKDQTYVLYSLTQEQLAHTVFPLGGMTKDRTREIAEAHGFVNAKKHDSQDICFVVDGDYAKFIEGYSGQTFPEGDFIDMDGNVLGRHKGLIRYTIGQRKGLGLALPQPMYVVSKSIPDNTVTLGLEKDLLSSSLTAEDLNWISVESLPDEGIRCSAVTRYHKKEQPCIVKPDPETPGRAIVTFDEPQRAVTPGQAVVFYDGDIVVGGGTITASK